jgi:hypothetical protein
MVFTRSFVQDGLVNFVAEGHKLILINRNTGQKRASTTTISSRNETVEFYFDAEDRLIGKHYTRLIKQAPWRRLLDYIRSHSPF